LELLIENTTTNNKTYLPVVIHKQQIVPTKWELLHFRKSFCA